MRVKKSGSKVYGASLTAAEKKAMDMEIQRQLAEYDHKNAKEIDALVLCILHEEFGFGEKRLKKFHDRLYSGLNELVERYCLDKSDEVWLCTYKLKQYGIDLDIWHNESRGD